MSDGTLFGGWLRQRRRERGLTYKELAQQVGCSVAALEKIESGIRRPSRQIAELLARYFDIPGDEREAFIEFARGDGLAGSLNDLEKASALRVLAPWRHLRTLKALQSLQSRPNNLPAQRTAFVGREDLVAEITSMLRLSYQASKGAPAFVIPGKLGPGPGSEQALRGVRLLTLTGPPGIGKTRLALRVAMEVLEDFAGGVFFVPLAATTDPGLVGPDIARTLGIRETGGHDVYEKLKEHLRSRQMLLVLDNFEQVVDAAPVISELLDAAPGLTIIVTSRQRLHLYGEHEIEVPALTLPDSHSGASIGELMRYDAVRLFADRAEAARHDFAVTAENAHAVAQICRRLDGLPLAIELAAARVRSFSPQELLPMLAGAERHTASGEAGARAPLRLLAEGPRDLPARHQTLRNAIEWSYNLLAEGEKKLFRRLSVFAGGGTLEAARAVASPGVGGPSQAEIDVLDGITSLVDKSLLRQEDIPQSPEHSEVRNPQLGEPRFFMLETIREYGWECIVAANEAGELKRRHAYYYLEMVETVQAQLWGPQQAAWLDRLEMEHDNIRAALHYARETQDGELAIRLAGALWKFWLVRGYLTEGRRQLAEALSLVETDGKAQPSEQASGPGSPAAIAKALNGAGILASTQGDYDAARPSFERSLDLYRELDDKPNIAGLLGNLGNVERAHGNYARARALQEESLAIRRELGDKQGTANTLSNLGNVAHAQGDYDAARALHEESLEILRELGDKWTIATALNNLGVVVHDRGDYDTARLIFEESLALRRELGDKRGIARSLHNLGALIKDLGDHPQAKMLYQESLSMYEELGDRPGAALCLESLAKLAGLQGQAHRAALLWGAAEGLREAIGTPLLESHRIDHDRVAAAARDQSDGAVFDAAWREGRSMPLHEAIAFALERPTTGNPQ